MAHTILRGAGFNERRCIARDVLGLYGCIVTIARYDGTATTDLRHTLLAALHQCVERHAALSVVVKDALTEKPMLARLDSIDIAKHLMMLPSSQSSDKDSFQTLLDVAHAQKLDDYEARPQWRVWALPVSSSSFYLAFAASHAIMDGRSGMFFHRSLVETLNNPAAASDNINARLPPALDEAARLPISWSFLLRPLLEEMLPSRISAMLGLSIESDAWHGADERPTVPAKGELVKTAFKVALIDSATLSTVLAACRSQNSKLTALLNLTIAQSLAVALQKRGQSYEHFIASTPYDLRGQIPGSTTCIANYASAVNQTFKVDRASREMNDQDWQQVREATAVLQQRSTTLNNQPVALLKYLSNFKEWVSKRATQRSQESFEVSNLGNLANDDSQAWLISQMCFSQSANAVGAPLNINVASCKGLLSIVMTWWPGMLGVADEHGFVQDVCGSLETRLAAITTR